MKYIWLNMKRFIHSETTLFTLFAICIIATVITILFFFGLFQNLEQEKQDSVYGEKMLFMTMVSDFDDLVTLDKVKDYCLGLSSDIHKNCYFSVGGRLKEDKDEATDLEAHLGMEFGIENGKFTLSPIARDYWRDFMQDGSYFSANQIENGEMVCVALPDDVRKRMSYAPYFRDKYAPQADGTYVIAGNTYTCIGHASYGGWLPKVPVTTVDDDCPVWFISLNFKDYITKSQYSEITDAARAAFGDYVEIPPLPTVDLDMMRYYRAALLECSLMMVMAGIVLSVLFRYILMLRKRQLTIFRLCGMTVKKAKSQYLVECILLTVFCSITGLLIYHFALLPQFAKLYKYIRDYYAWYTYLLLIVLYIGVVCVMQYFMIKRTTQDEIVTVLRGNEA